MTKLFSRDGGPQGKFARRGRCFDIGTWGGCGVFCPAFIDGECGEPQEIPAQEIVDAHGQGDAEEIMAQYPCFANGAIKNRWSQLDAGFTKARAAVAKAHKRVASGHRGQQGGLRTVGQL